MNDTEAEEGASCHRSIHVVHRSNFCNGMFIREILATFHRTTSAKQDASI
jgi:hypothetical protein